MSTLSSTSTDAEVQAAYDDNASYAEDRSLVKARAFVTAVRLLIRRTATRLADGGTNVEHSVDLLHKQLEQAQAFLAQFDSAAAPAGAAANVTFADFGGPRA